MDTCLKLSAFATVNMAAQLDESYRTAVCCHNNEVPKNLDHLIGCVKFCGVFDLALQDMDKMEQPWDFLWTGR